MVGASRFVGFYRGMDEITRTSMPGGDERRAAYASLSRRAEEQGAENAKQIDEIEGRLDEAEVT